MLRWVDGFDAYGTTGDISIPVLRNYNATSTLSVGDEIFTVPGRYGGSGIVLSSTVGEVTFKKYLPAPTSGLIVGFNMKQVTNMVTNTPFAVTSGSDTVVSGFYQNGISFCSGQIIRLNGAAVGSVPDNDWHHYEVIMPIIPTAGNPMSLYMDGILFGSTVAPWTYNQNLMVASSLAPTYHHFDDYYVLDISGQYNTTRLASSGNIPRVKTLLPTANFIADFSPAGAGSIYETQDNIPYESAQYMHTSTVNHSGTFVMSDSDAIYPAGVKFQSLAKESTAGALDTFKFVLNQNSIGPSCDASGTLGISVTGKFVGQLFDTNPATLSAWTSGELSSMTAGITNI